MNVLGLYDGISCGQVALNEAGIKVDKYYASEIDKYAIQVTQKNYPNTIQISDILEVDFTSFAGEIDLLLGGSPCTFWSIAKQGREVNKDGVGWKLFKRYIDALETVKPKYFLYENVASMPNTIKDFISEEFSCDPIMIDSQLVSAQMRKRLYWTNIPGIQQPEDRGILLQDVVLNGFVDRDKSRAIISSIGRTTHREYFKKHQGQMVYEIDKLIHSEKALEYMNRQITDGRNHWDFQHHSDIRNAKSATVVANFFKGVPYNVLKDWDCVRKLHPIECERLQTLPVLTPESQFERHIIKDFDFKNSNVKLFKGSFKSCQGGWTRLYQDEDSIIISCDYEKTE